LRGCKITVLETAAEPEPAWSARSYSINLNPRGHAALEAAGVLEEVVAVSAPRNCMVLVDGTSNKHMVIPRRGDPAAGVRPNVALSRSALVTVLEEHATRNDGVTVRRGVRVSGVKEEEDFVEVSLLAEDGGVATTLRGSHVIGADGKWSAVRRSIPALDGLFRMREEPSWGISMLVPSVPSAWESDGTLVFKPSEGTPFAIIGSPLKDGTCSISMVCYDEILGDHPWLYPTTTGQQHKQWLEEATADTTAQQKKKDSALLAERLEELLQREMPHFLEELDSDADNSKDAILRAAVIQHRTSWLEPTSESPVYGTSRVALIGDAAHAVTPSIGEGCNCALESAVCLLAGTTGDFTTASLSAAFLSYATTRPKTTVPIQMRSGAASRFKSSALKAARAKP